ncbi:hypothetical protein Tcan_01165, partial [Toxocara canis]
QHSPYVERGTDAGISTTQVQQEQPSRTQTNHKLESMSSYGEAAIQKETCHQSTMTASMFHPRHLWSVYSVYDFDFISRFSRFLDFKSIFEQKDSLEKALDVALIEVPLLTCNECQYIGELTK